MPAVEEFNGAKEPMRALRDLIDFCEATMGSTHGGDPAEQAILARAQDGFTTLRKLFGDARLAEDINRRDEMIEPADLIDAFQVTAGALQCIAPLLPAREHHLIRFTGEWSRFGTQTVGAILNRANAALPPKAEG